MLNLIVIYVKDIEKTVSFYNIFDLIFEKEKHGSGVEHYAYEKNGIVFEIYPENNNLKSNTSLKLGFKVDSIEKIKNRLNILDVKYSELLDGIKVEDPDGRTVFLRH